MNSMDFSGPAGALKQLGRSVLTLMAGMWVYKKVDDAVNATEGSLPDLAVKTGGLMGLLWMYEHGWIKTPDQNISISGLLQTPTARQQ